MRKLVCLLAFLVWFVPSAFAQHTYYVSFSAGADTNTSTQAQSKSTPWKSLTGMRSATSNAASYSPVAGDTFVLMGCDDWPNASFPISWSAGGTSGSHITIGVDQTWFNATNCPSGWNRPIFDANTAIMGVGAECTALNMFFNVSGITYVDFNWIELKNYFQNANCPGANDRYASLNSPADFITFNFFYIHASITGASSPDNDRMFSVSGTNCQHCFVNQSVINNSDGTQYTTGGIQFGMTRTVCAYVSNCAKPTVPGEIAYNDIHNIGVVIGSVHPNCIETAGNGTFTWFIHDNNVHDMTGTHEQCETLQIGNTGETDYVWNNLFYNLGGADIMRFPQGSGKSPIALYFFNNTFVSSPSNVCGDVGTNGGSWSLAFVMVNNHCIPTLTPGGTSQSQLMISGAVSGATTITFTHNVVQSAATATAAGYTASQTPYVYFPINGSATTVGAGTNLTGTSTFPSGFTTNDTSYACSQQTISGVVQSVCPSRAQNARPATGSWDSGVYEFSASGSVATPTFSPAGGTYTGTQTVTGSTTTAGATLCGTIDGSTPTEVGNACSGGTTFTYTGPLTVPSTRTIKLLGTLSGFTDSLVASATYVINPPTVATPSALQVLVQ